jgi:hypothetical protein
MRFIIKITKKELKGIMKSEKYTEGEAKVALQASVRTLLAVNHIDTKTCPVSIEVE